MHPATSYQLATARIADLCHQRVVLDGSSLTCADVNRVARLAAPVQLSTEPAVRERVARAREMVAAAVAAGETVYGVTTGFGGMADTAIPPDLAEQLQESLLAFLHTGAGDRLPERDVRAAMLIRANSHLRGASGVRWELIERSVVLLRAGVTPVVRDLGSIGASGDLVPLAAIARAVIGSERQQVVTNSGTVTTARAALSALGLPPLRLQAKEGLALVNGTAVSTARATLCVLDAIDYVERCHGIPRAGRACSGGEQRAIRDVHARAQTARRTGPDCRANAKAHERDRRLRITTRRAARVRQAWTGPLCAALHSPVPRSGS